MFRSEIKVQNPDAVEATVTITMTLGEWKSLQAQLRHGGNRYPSWKLDAAIGNLVRAIEQQFFVNEADVNKADAEL